MTDRELDRLRRRLERERAARLEAEGIAERGLRQLYEANIELDRRVAERTAQLERARMQADSANEAKSRFLSNVSHEIRTPLNAILGSLSLVDRDHLDVETAAHVAVIGEGAERLHLLLRDLLVVAELGGLGDDDLAGADLDDLGDAVLARWQRVAAERGLLLTVGVECPWLRVELDLPRVNEVIDRLVDHALRSGIAGKVEVVIGCMGADGPSVLRIEVRCSGAGLHGVSGASFDPLIDRADSVTGSSSGVGLGLSVVRTLVDVMGGERGVDERGGVTVMWFRVPVTPLTV